MSTNISQNVTLELGRILSEQREHMGYSTELVRNKLLLSRQQLSGLETNNFSSFYSRALFLKSLKKYALFLNYDGRYLRDLDQMIDAEVVTRVEQEIAHSRGYGKPVTKVTSSIDRYLIIAGVILLVVVILITVNELRYK